MQTNEPASSKPTPEKTPADSAPRPAWYQDALARLDLYKQARELGVIWFPGAPLPFRSVDISKIGPALLQLQAEMGKALKDSKNDHFGSKYADLASVYDASRGAIITAGLRPQETTMRVNGTEILYIEMIHPESGQFVAGYAELKYGNKDNPQAYGSALTYARRYALSAILGVVSDEDDDGNLAAGHGQNRGGTDDRGPPRRRDDRPQRDERPREPRPAAEDRRSAPPQNVEDKIAPPAAPLKSQTAKTLANMLEKMPLTFVAEGVPEVARVIINVCAMALTTEGSPDEVLATYAETLSVAHAHIARIRELGERNWVHLRSRLINARYEHWIKHKLPGHEAMGEFMKSMLKRSEAQAGRSG